ncbi:hypothetical protein O5706_19705 [Escherichia coli]|nr:hypothetical protein [Escherichia coli]
MFRRLGLPESLIARNREEYISAVLSLTETPRLRERLQKFLTENDVEKVLFEGQPENLLPGSGNCGTPAAAGKRRERNEDLAGGGL